MRTSLGSILAALALVAAAPGQTFDRLFDAPSVAFDRFTRISEALDFDADGDVDLAGGTQVATVLGQIDYRVFRNNGSGGFGLAGVISFPSLGIPAQDLRAAVLDFDGDGRDDVALFIGSTLRVVTDFNSAFAASPPWAGLGFVVTGAVGLDVDADGRDDLVTATASELTVLYSGPTGVAPAPWSLPLGGSLLNTRLTRADVNGDPLTDVVVTFDTTASVGVRTFVAGSGVLTPLHSFTTTLLRDATPLSGDIDGDGRSDLVLSGVSQGSPGFQIFRNVGAGVLVPAGQTTGFRLAAIGDLNGDGVDDYLGFINSLGATLRLVRGSPGGLVQPPDATILAVAHPAADATLADLDGDSDLDVLLTEPSGISVFVNDAVLGIVLYAVLQPGVAGTTSQPHSIRCADFDLDGDLDLASFPAPMSADTGTVFVPGTPTPFAFDVPNSVVFTSLGAHFADLDGDGDLDAATLPLRRNLRFDAPLGGLRRQYGVGLAGSGGIVPLLGAAGPFRVGTNIVTRIAAGLGGASGLLAIGSAEASSPIGPGTLLLQPLGYLPVTLGGAPAIPGAGRLDLAWLAPPSLSGVELRLQAGFADPLAPGGIALTSGLLLAIGP